MHDILYFLFLPISYEAVSKHKVRCANRPSTASKEVYRMSQYESKLRRTVSQAEPGVARTDWLTRRWSKQDGWHARAAHACEAMATTWRPEKHIQRRRKRLITQFDACPARHGHRYRHETSARQTASHHHRHTTAWLAVERRETRCTGERCHRERGKIVSPNFGIAENFLLVGKIIFHNCKIGAENLPFTKRLEVKLKF